jgi:hypothetical protein
MGISSTEFEKKCKEIVPEIEAKVKDRAPNVVSVTQFFYLQDTLALNLAVAFKTPEGKDNSFPVKIGAAQVMTGDCEPIVDAIVKAVTK